jgi:hypothetical protein
VAARSKGWVCGRSPAGIAGSYPVGGMDICLSVASVVCCQSSLLQADCSCREVLPTEARLCDLETSRMKAP